MEVHAPSKPILTVKEAAVHLAIVTIGILIALSFDGLIEWVGHRSLVREARVNIVEEIRGNRDQLTTFVETLQVHRQNILATLQALNEMPLRPNEVGPLFTAGTPAGGQATNFLRNYMLAELRTMSRTTAEATGALALMEYSEVQRYAAVYDRQQLFMTAQDRANSDVAVAFSLGQAIDFGAISATELEAIRRQLRVAFGGTLVEEEMARLLLAEYGRALEAAPLE